MVKILDEDRHSFRNPSGDGEVIEHAFTSEITFERSGLLAIDVEAASDHRFGIVLTDLHPVQALRWRIKRREDDGWFCSVDGREVDVGDVPTFVAFAARPPPETLGDEGILTHGQVERQSDVDTHRI